MVNYLKPINRKIEEIKKTPNNGIFLVGEVGSGKTTTLLEYVKQNKNTNKPVIDVTLIANYSLQVYGNIAKLFQMCNIIQKMLLYIQETNPENYVEYFIFFNARITNIQKDIVSMYSLDKYNIDNTCIDKMILNHPEILLEEFLTKALKYLNYQDITLILDNFDVEKPYMRLYQTYMYELLKKYLRVVATISDSNVINKQNKLDNLAQNNTLIMMDYNHDINTVKKILDSSLINQKNNKIVYRRISFMYNNETIEKLIEKTNGNLFAMILAIKIFFERIDEINADEYDNYLLAILDENLKFNNLLNSRHKSRKLYLK